MTSGVNSERRPAAGGGKMGDPGIICDYRVGLPQDSSQRDLGVSAARFHEAIIAAIILAQRPEFRRLAARADEYDVCVSLIQEQADKPLVAVERPITHSRIAERGNDDTLGGRHASW